MIGGLMERYLSRSGWYLTDTQHPPLPNPELIYFFMKPIISMFQEPIKIVFLSFGQLSKFLLIYELYF